MSPVRFLLGFALLFALAPMAQAAPKDTPAVAAVRQFLAARAAGDTRTAYDLLAAASKQTFSAKRFADGDWPPPDTPARMSQPVYGLGVLFSDTHDMAHYTFAVLGPDPADPHAVLVRATPPASAAGVLASTLRIVTVTAPSGAACIDVRESLRRADPEGFAKGARAISQSNLKQLSLAIIQYAFDHGNHLPDADKWVDEILPYWSAVKDDRFHVENLFRDPSAPGQSSAYAFNRALSGATLDAPRQPSGVVDSVRTPKGAKAPAASTVLLFESTLGTRNASDAGQSVPRPGRQMGGTDYAFADGHVRWLPNGTTPAFAP